MGKICTKLSKAKAKNLETSKDINNKINLNKIKEKKFNKIK